MALWSVDGKKAMHRAGRNDTRFLAPLRVREDSHPNYSMYKTTTKKRVMVRGLIMV